MLRSDPGYRYVLVSIVSFESFFLTVCLPLSYVRMRRISEMLDHNAISSNCYVFLLAKAYQKGHGLVQKRLHPYGVTNVQYVVLEALWHQEGLTAVELGQLLTIDKATLSGILDRMTDADLVIKRQDTQDKRMIRLYPTEKANNLKNNLVEERKRANEELLAGFTREERILLRRFLLSIT